MATRALKASWCRKWIVDLRMRPEEYGALVEARRTSSTPVPQASTELHTDVLTSAVLPKILAKHGSHLLPQAYPEGSPTHPCYTGGHATVAGACCTAIKFFFDGRPKAPSAASSSRVATWCNPLRWPFASHLHRRGQRSDRYQWRTEQGGIQRLLWSRSPRRHSLPQLQLLGSAVG